MKKMIYLILSLVIIQQMAFADNSLKKVATEQPLHPESPKDTNKKNEKQRLILDAGKALCLGGLSAMNLTFTGVFAYFLYDYHLGRLFIDKEEFAKSVAVLGFLAAPLYLSGKLGYHAFKELEKIVPQKPHSGNSVGQAEPKNKKLKNIMMGLIKSGAAFASILPTINCFLLLQGQIPNASKVDTNFSETTKKAFWGAFPYAVTATLASWLYVMSTLGFSAKDSFVKAFEKNSNRGAQKREIESKKAEPVPSSTDANANTVAISEGTPEMVVPS